MSLSELTPWYPSNMKPERVGVYRLAIANAIRYKGWSYSFWNGARWLKYGGWAHYPSMYLKNGFCWRGLNRPDAVYREILP